MFCMPVTGGAYSRHTAGWAVIHLAPAGGFFHITLYNGSSGTFLPVKEFESSWQQ
jgi:hypothetical protein